MTRPQTILRERANDALQTTLAGVWALPVILVSPDGVEYIHNALDAELPLEERRELAGQVLVPKKRFDPATGGDVVVGKVVVTLPVDSMERVPLETDGHWLCKAPIEPRWDAEKKIFRIGRPIEGGETHSMMRFYLEEIDDIDRPEGGLP